MWLVAVLERCCWLALMVRSEMCLWIVQIKKPKRCEVNLSTMIACFFLPRVMHQCLDADFFVLVCSMQRNSLCVFSLVEVLKTNKVLNIL